MSKRQKSFLRKRLVWALPIDLMKNHLKITSVCWLSKEAREAEVQITDGDFTLHCFAHPF